MPNQWPKFNVPKEPGDFIIPTEAYERVRFYDTGDPRRNMPALFNPNELPEDTEATIGELNPIGSSSTTLQYAHTKATSYSLTLQFSYRAMVERGSPMIAVAEAKNFFKSFLYATHHGKAPTIMQMVWPNFMSVNYVVKRVNVRYTRWDLELQLREYVVELSLIENRRTFLSSTQLNNGQINIPPDTAGTHAPRSGLTRALTDGPASAGRPLRVTGRVDFV
jgi:hypothetical protein